MITRVPSPAILPETVSQYSAHWSVEAWAESDAVALRELLPTELAKAVPKRQAEFVAGRVCAIEALRAAGCSYPQPPAIGSDRAPVWPLGFVGSITHTDGFASAAVARVADVQGVGIDSEGTMQEPTAVEIADCIAGAGELSILQESIGRTWSHAELMTLLFSAKESVYKCLYPLTGWNIRFPDLSAVAVDLNARTITFDLNKAVRTSRPATTASHFTVRWELFAQLLHTGCIAPSL